MNKGTDISKERLEYLFKALTENTISKEELEELAACSRILKDDEVFHSSVKEIWNNVSVKPEEDILDSELVYENIISDSRFQKANPKRKIFVFNGKVFLRYAAVLLLTAGVGLWFYVNKPETGPEKGQQLIAVKKDSGTEDAKAVMLTLADGSQIALDKVSNGVLTVQGDSKVEHQDGQITYQDGVGLGLGGGKALENTVTTPRGADFKIVLPDGTKVWLNTMSSLSYPVMFNGKERKVRVNGEAYFEVAKNPHKPFIVEANGTEVSVLGTHFNVNAYSNENAVKTTLIEGAVKVTNHTKSVLLKPGEQSTASLSKNDIKVSTVDTEETLAWKNGYFLFNDENITTVMRTIARWYDITVEYDGNIDGKTFGGTISRFEDIEQLLKSIEMTGAIRFKLMPATSGKERRVIVMP
ncbi:FecR domain-containing protein [Pseudopedobacter sp.]|uniref:FecR family protein n=1 Tax=Pseudopedobacter sp. TaxID=1936787 RepID=UPI00333E949D